MNAREIRAEIGLARNRMELYTHSLESDCGVESAALSHMAHYSKEMGNIFGRSLPEELVKRAGDYFDKRKGFWWKVFDDALGRLGAETTIPDGCKEVLEGNRGNQPPLAVANSGMPIETARNVLTVYDGLLRGEYGSEGREMTREAIQIHADYISFLESLLPHDI